ncbi:carboxylating nicotinate-nucleotide diphosphorylase [Chloroflexota bacterium]
MKQGLQLSNKEIDSIIDLALSEDVSQGDVTSEALMPPELQGRASIMAEAGGILAGIEVVKRVFFKVDPLLKTRVLIKDGAKVRPGDTVATISGRVVSVLRGERVVLNFLSRLSGIATYTARFVAEVVGYNVLISDTRKTTPGLRRLEKYAVSVGGGRNHRFHLGDGILIKDNHITALRAQGMSLQDIVLRAKQDAPKNLKIEVEAGTAGEALEAAEGGADIVMLDNINPDEMHRIKALLPENVMIEASGGISLKNVRAAAQAGVDIISVGALTHSAQALDFSLDFEPGTIKN